MASRKSLPQILVAAEERSEAAIGGVAVVKPNNAFLLKDRVRRFCERFARDRNLASLLSGYKLG